MLLPEGNSAPFSLSAGDLVKIRMTMLGFTYYRGLVRGLVTKMPGFKFSGRNTVLLFNSAIMTID